ncbi:MAG: LamG domain-containing protein [Nannocystaceae bacterium]|nr:LamG domain-containing protein [Nannocystaceae bacterium]
MRVAVGIVGLWVGLACGPPAAFLCQSDAQCDQPSDPHGTCEAGGYCSYPDGTCDSGRRFGAHAPDEVAQQCVTVGPAASSTSGSTAARDSGSEGGQTSTGASGDTLALTSGASSTTSGVSTGMSEGSDGGSTGELSDPDLVLWLTFDDLANPFADWSDYAREVRCELEAGACPEITQRGVSSNACLFDAVNDVLEVPHDPDLETDGGLTVALKVRNDVLSDPSIHTVIARPFGIGTDNSWEIYFRDQDNDDISELVFEIVTVDGDQRLVATPSAGKGERMHIVAVWSPEMMALYIDGELQVSEPSSPMGLDDGSVYVGGDLDDEIPDNFFGGAVDDVRVYRRVLDPDEIAALAL